MGALVMHSFCRVLRLTVLAPAMVEAILGGRQPAEMALAALMRPVSLDWQRQRSTLAPLLT